MKLVYSPVTYEKTYTANCAHCGNRVAMIVKLELFETYKASNGNVVPQLYPQFAVGYCPECGYPLIQDLHNHKTIPAMREFDTVSFLPEDVERLYNEMRDAYAASAYTCCVITGRTLLAKVAVEEGAEENKGFVYYVDYLVNGFLPKSNSKPWVDKIRQLGNDSAHKYVIADKEQATLTLKFLEAILKNVYEFPNSI